LSAQVARFGEDWAAAYARVTGLDVSGEANARIRQETLRRLGINPGLLGDGPQTGGGFGANGDFGAIQPARARNPRGGKPMMLSTTGADVYLDIKVTSLADNPVNAKISNGGKAGKGAKGRSEADEYRDIVKAMQEKIAAQEVESRTIGMTAAEAEKLQFAEEALAKMRREGIAETPERIAQIEQMAAKYAELAEQTRRQEEAARAAEEQAAFFGDLVTGALTDMIANGASAEDVVKRLAASLAEAAIQAAILGKGPLADLFGGGAGGGLFGAIGGLFGRASGGPVQAGTPYLVGETGAETFVPSSPGRILPARDTRNGAGQSINFAPVTQVAAGVTAPELRAIIEANNAKWRQSLPAMIKDAAGRRQL